MPVRRGDRVAVITRSLCRYEGNYLTMNNEKQTFTLSDVKAFGTENRRAEDFFPAVQDTYECVEFDAGDVNSLSVVDFRDLRDPAIVNVHGNRRNDRHDWNEQEFHRGPLRDLNSRGRTFTRGPRVFGNSNRSFRNDWIGLGAKSEGSFPQRNPGASGNSLEEFDFEKGIEEFTQLKLNESVEDFDPEKQSPETSPEKQIPQDDDLVSSPYDKQKSFFDNLSNSAGMGPRKPWFPQRTRNPNIETFGLDTVQQLYDYHRVSNDQRYGFRSRGNFRRNAGGGFNENVLSHGSRNRQNAGPFHNAVSFH
ncbi:uncharacterized protein LOC100899289 [Galendromus occidentalis]|uniref:Uncharacterized protein LOC100899289 n=1 Tax=Galendromus occidentalis TaxID=34638 RepID=A0AAJ6QWK2_9ACAR|nr:uncharacterized protein LOC100899289 [Galendromus occidentalis]